MKNRYFIFLLITGLLISSYISITTYIYNYDFTYENDNTGFFKNQNLFNFNKQKKNTKILIIDSYHSGYMVSQKRMSGFLKKLIDYNYIDKKHKRQIFANNVFFKDNYKFETTEIKRLWLDAKRYPNTSDLLTNIESVIKFIHEYIPDILIVSEDYAVKYIGSYFYDSSIPIIFCGVNTSPFKYGLINDMENPGANMTGVYQNEFIFETLNLYKILMNKNYLNALYISESSQTSNSKIKYIDDNSHFYKDTLNFDSKIVTNNFEELKKAVMKYNIEKNIDVYLTGILGSFKDSKGNLMSSEEVLNWLLENAEKPVLTNLFSYIQAGALLGVVEDEEMQGKLAAEQFHLIMQGNHPSKIKVLPDTNGLKVINRGVLKNTTLNIEQLKMLEPDLIVIE